MIPTKARETRRMKVLKLSKNLERKYKEVKCRECTVVVTPMDFAKILGKFTKVKIQYESNLSSKSKSKQTNVVSPSSRLKAKENGMVQLHRHAYNAHPAQKLKKRKASDVPKSTSNVLKENNRLKKPIGVAVSDYTARALVKSQVKYYGIVFDKPLEIKPSVIRNKISLQDLVSDINTNILPAEDWCIDYFPKNGEPKDDKIYDRIAAELEDLMYNEKTKINSNVKENKNDEFPSILDILNENTKDSTIKTSDPATSLNLESSDVEAMLLGNTTTEPAAMDVDSSVSSLTGKAAQPAAKPDVTEHTVVASTIEDNPESPSILDEPIQKDTSSTETAKITIEVEKIQPTTSQITDQTDENDNTNNNNSVSRTGVTQIIFKKSVNGTCHKSVTCPKNLKYSISMLGKSVQLLGAPTHISSLADLQVLLQIVEESELNNLYVLH